MADVHLPRSLVALFPGAPRRLEAAGATVAEVIADLDAQVPGIRNRLVDAGPTIRTHINVFVEGQRASLATPVPAGAVVHVIPAVSGGMQEGLPAGPAEMPPAHADTGPRAESGGAALAGPGSGGGIDDPRALQILTTEHWSLLTARSLVYNEAFARAGMFLAFLSATLFALGLISTATGFSDGFLAIAAVILALDLFVGLATLGRIVAASAEDIRYLQGMNRLRHAYFEIVPGLDPYFITSHHDDPASVLAFYGPPAPGPLGNIGHGLTTTPGMIGVICSAVAGGFAAAVTLLAAHDPTMAATVGVIGCVLFFLLLNVVIVRNALGLIRGLQSVFPPQGTASPPNDPRVTPPR